MYFLNQIFAGISILRENFYSFSYLYLWAEVSLCGYVLNAFKNHEILETNSQLNLIILFSFISVYFWERRLKIFCAIVGTKAGRIGAVLIGGFYTTIVLSSFLLTADILLDSSKPKMETVQDIYINESHEVDKASRYSYYFSSGPKNVEIDISESTYRKFSSIDHKKIAVKYYKYRGFFGVPWFSKDQVELVAIE